MGAVEGIGQLREVRDSPVGGFLTPAALKLDPAWDPLRGDPRFQELLEERRSAVGRLKREARSRQSKTSDPAFGLDPTYSQADVRRILYTTKLIESRP